MHALLPWNLQGRHAGWLASELSFKLLAELLRAEFWPFRGFASGLALEVVDVGRVLEFLAAQAEVLVGRRQVHLLGNLLLKVVPGELDLEVAAGGAMKPRRVLKNVSFLSRVRALVVRY